MADDIVTRLRDVGFCGVAAQQEAADEIERLRAAGDALVSALENNMMATAVVLVNQWLEARRDAR